MFDQLESLVLRYEELLGEMQNNPLSGERFQVLMKETGTLRPIVDAYRAYKDKNKALSDDLSMLDEESDPEMKNLLKEEIQALKAEIPELEKTLRVLMLPKDRNDGKNVVLEVRSGVGGDEAALFAADIFRMYSRYAALRHWKVETTEYNESGIGGANRITAIITGEGAYSALKFESGVHRVQRIPKTESQGRIHTSTCTVAVLPEAEEVDVNIDLNDCRFDVFRASGNGGQCVNTTDSAVRLTHLPTGIVISCQDEKSQLKNRAKALKVLRAKLYDLERRLQHEKEADERKSMVGSGDRSEKIRTYNYPQGRITDYRINMSFFRLPEMMDGDLQELFDALNTADQAEKLSKEA